MTIDEQRQAVIREAETWIGTPFHHAAAVKGAGVDCVHLPAEAYNRALGVHIEVPDYPAQWHLHKKDGVFNELYLNGLFDQGFMEISAEDKKPADLAVSKLLRTFCHGAIIADWPWVIQAECKEYGANAVVRRDALANWYFQLREVRFFSWKAWH